MKFKKIFIVLFTLLFCLTSCNKENTESSSSIQKTEYFEVNWKVEDTIVKTEKVKKGKIPKYEGDIPTKESTKEKYFKFSGWEPKPTKIEEDTTFVATFTDSAFIYTINFDTNGGENVNSISKEYGSLIMQNNLPTAKKEGLHFTGWTLDKENTQPVVYPYKIVDDVTFYAQYSEQIENVKLLNELLANYSINPYKLIPANMQDSSYLVNNDATLNYDYSTNKNIADLNEKGLYEGYKNVLQILNETNNLSNQINFAIGLVGTASSLAYSAYIESNPVDINNFQYSSNGAKINIAIINNNLVYTAEFNTATIKLKLILTLNTKTKVITGNISLSDDHRIKYTVSNDELKFFEHNLTLDRYIYISKNKDNVIKGEINDINGLINNVYEIKYDENETLITSEVNGNHNIELYDTKSGKPLYEIKKGLINKVNINMEDITSFLTIRKEKEKFFINDKEFKTELSLAPSFNISLIKKYYPVKESIINPKLNYKPHDLPVLNVNVSKLDTLKEDVISLNKDLEFTLTTDIENVKKHNNLFNNYIDMLNLIKNSFTKDDINNITK